MTLTVNGQRVDLPVDGTGSATVVDLLAHLKLTGQPCAVEVNKTLVPKRSHAAHALRENDTIEVVTLVGGG
jgi:thiamine biosynthesis protein ThiS